jgi:hypothetical protein
VKEKIIINSLVAYLKIVKLILKIVLKTASEFLLLLSFAAIGQFSPMYMS